MSDTEANWRCQLRCQLRCQPCGASPVPAPALSLITAISVVYGLFGRAAVVALASHGFHRSRRPLGGIAGIVAIIVAYVKRGEATGTPVSRRTTLASDPTWFSLLWGLQWPDPLLMLALVLVGFIVDGPRSDAKFGCSPADPGYPLSGRLRKPIPDVTRWEFCRSGPFVASQTQST